MKKINGKVTIKSKNCQRKLKYVSNDSGNYGTTVVLEITIPKQSTETIGCKLVEEVENTDTFSSQSP